MKQKSLIAICIIISTCSMSNGIFAYSSFASLDTIIQRAGESIRPKDTFTSLNKSIDMGDIYSTSYKLAQEEFSTKVLGTVSAMAGEINGKYSCNMTMNDIGNILTSISDINNEVQGALAVINESKSSQDNAGFNQSCVKLLNCMGGKKAANANANNLQTNTPSVGSDLGFQTCKSYAAQVYNAKSRILGPTVDLASTVQGNDIFYNGDDKDAPYDILIDMQHIGDILFADNQQTDKTLFFTFPNNTVAGFQTLAFDGNTTNSTVNNPILFGNTNTNQPSNQQGGRSIQQGTEQSGQGKTTTSNGKQTIDNNLPSIPTNITTVGATNTVPIVANNSPNTATSIENYACTIPAPTGTTTNSTNTSSTTSNNGEQTTSNNIDDNQNQTDNNGEPIPTNPAQGVFTSNSPYYSPTVSDASDPIIANGNWESPSDYATQSASIKSCINKCDGLKIADKALCAAKCMCGTSYSADGMFGLSVCTVPSTQTDVAGSKSVQSIEDIITEINNVLLALKNSGEMIKHNKTTEMFDTALAKIKLNKIFAFDINIGFKPVIDSNPDFSSKQKSQDADDILAKGTYGSIEIANERNKYITLYNPVLEQAKKQGGNNLTEIQDNIIAADAQIKAFTKQKLSDDITNALAQSQNAEVADIVKNFIEQNIRFLTYLNDSLANTQNTVDQFRQKIEAGSKQ